MHLHIKRFMLYLAKYSGLFHLARIVTARQLRILCYHGLSLRDEHRFQPRLFIRPEVLRRRMRTLRECGFPVLALDAALEKLRRGALPRNATVVTFDDGFFSNYSKGIDILGEFEIPATIYVTTYYALANRPVFRLVVRYLFWKTQRTTLDLGALGLGWEGTLDLASAEERDRGMWKLIEHAESRLDEEQRDQLERVLAERLGLGFEELLESRSLSLMTKAEIREAVEAGVSIQLHTHRHRFPIDESVAVREIKENRAVLESIPGVSARHFCYPCGEWAPEQWPWLEAERVESATTCDPGLNDASTPRFGLRRFLDADTTPQIEFEAEIYGFTEILRRLFKRRQTKQHVWNLRNPRP